MIKAGRRLSDCHFDRSGERAVSSGSGCGVCQRYRRSMRRVLYRNLVYQKSGRLERGRGRNLMTKAINDVDACAEGMRKFTTEVFDTGVVMIAYLGDVDGL